MVNTMYIGRLEGSDLKDSYMSLAETEEKAISCLLQKYFEVEEKDVNIEEMTATLEEEDISIDIFEMAVNSGIVY